MSSIIDAKMRFPGHIVGGRLGITPRVVPCMAAPDIPTFQALGFYWCSVTAADAAFFGRIIEGPPYPASDILARGDYPNCLTG